ncbi:MAG: DNA translocase FtsK [Bacteroidales bacterium]|nr:DNA translocase FtsK [Bacteroidales bacterium]
MKKSGKGEDLVNKFATPKNHQKDLTHGEGDFSLKKFFKILFSKDAFLVYSLLLFLFSLYVLISFVSYLFTWMEDDIWLQALGKDSTNFNITPANAGGKIGAYLGFIFVKQSFGIGSFVLLTFLFILSLRGMYLIKLDMIKTFSMSIVLTLFFSILMAFLFYDQPVLGGLIGKNIINLLQNLFGKIFTGIILFLIAFVITFLLIPRYIKKFYKKLFTDVNNVSTSTSMNIENNSAKITIEPELASTEQNLSTELDNVSATEVLSKPVSKATEIELDLEEDVDTVPSYYDNISKEVSNELLEAEVEDKINSFEKERKVIPLKLDDQLPPYLNKSVLHDEISDDNFVEHVENPFEILKSYNFPSLDLLTYHGRGETGVTREELEENKKKIIETLRNYEIDIVKIKATIGPTVTMYEIVPAPGVRISKIRNLEDDIALSLSALGIRIIAPIPGKGTIGIEVPNQKREIVSLRSMLETDKFQNHSGELPFVLGKTITNEPFVSDLAKLPHLLIAGATGQGKSVGLNIIISSLLYKKHPSQLKFILIDPKKVELAPYNKLENHFLAKLPDEVEPIITDVSKVVKTLTSVTKLMDWRYDLLKEGGVKNIVEYNQKYLQKRLNPQKGHHYMPYIVVVIDEFADLIMTAGKEVELPVARIAQLARAVGIHLIIATQRPSVDVITGKIKANFPARIAFRVSSKVDSRTILDYNGAEQLIGMGDMLYLHGNDFLRIQCAYVDTDEIEKIVDFISNQPGYPHPFLLPEVSEEEQGESLQDVANLDRLFGDAARIVVSSQQGSTSLLQTRLNIGFARARRIIEQLEQTGIVGPPQGSKPRDVLVKDLNHLEQFLSNLLNKNTIS